MRSAAMGRWTQRCEAEEAAGDAYAAELEAARLEPSYESSAASCASCGAGLEAVADGVGRRLRPVLDVQLPQEARDVVADREGTDHERVRELVVGLAGREH